MRVIRGKHVLLGVVVCAIALTGCKKKRAGSGFGGDEGIGGVVGEDIYGQALPGRLEGMGEYQAGQFPAIHFEYDSAQIAPSERGVLDDVADHMRQDKSASLIVEGHSDERGSREYNLALGERRALAVRLHLVQLGVSGDRLITISFGEEAPAQMGRSEAAWAMNRRCEFNS